MNCREEAQATQETQAEQIACRAGRARLSARTGETPMLRLLIGVVLASRGRIAAKDGEDLCDALTGAAVAVGVGG